MKNFLARQLDILADHPKARRGVYWSIAFASAANRTGVKYSDNRRPTRSCLETGFWEAVRLVQNRMSVQESTCNRLLTIIDIIVSNFATHFCANAHLSPSLYSSH